MLTPWATLLITPAKATDQKVRERYHTLARDQHPDVRKTQDPGPEWYKLTSAYTQIKTEELRTAWLKARQRLARCCPRCEGSGVLGGLKLRRCNECAGTGVTQ